MGRDRSLDEFFGGDDDSESDAAADAGADPSDGASADAGDDAGVDPGESVDPDESESATDESGAESAAAVSEGGDCLPDASSVDPATPTYRWSPDGAACESCGATVERRWHDDGAFVCDDCKAW